MFDKRSIVNFKVVTEITTLFNVYDTYFSVFIYCSMRLSVSIVSFAKIFEFSNT